MRLEEAPPAVAIASHDQVLSLYASMSLCSLLLLELHHREDTGLKAQDRNLLAYKASHFEDLIGARAASTEIR